MAKRSLSSPKGFRKAFTNSQQPDGGSILAGLPVVLGPGAVGAPQLEQTGQWTERSGNTSSRLKDVIKMMGRGRV
jgi:hypothetical protein